jgi:hypothetical protein
MSAVSSRQARDALSWGVMINPLSQPVTILMDRGRGSLCFHLHLIWRAIGCGLK